MVRSFADGRAVPTTVECDIDVDGCLAMCDNTGECSVLAPVGVLQRIKIGSYFALWFLLSVGYSITNKQVNNVLACPYSVATSTVAIGSLFVSLLWLTGLRSAPRLSPTVAFTLLPIGLCHAIGHMAGTVAVCVGSVSFVQIVKAANPVYVCVLSTLFLRQAISRRVWLSLVPVVAGVSLAAVKELSFAWTALVAAAFSDFAMALRNVLSKRSMGVLTDIKGRSLSTTDMFGLLTVISTAVSVPVAIAVEGGALPLRWSNAAASAAGGSGGLAVRMGLAGLLFYAYNEVAMKALSNVQAVTHSVGSIIRRVVIMVTSMAVFGTPMRPLGIAGSGLAIAGSFLYANVKHDEKLRARELLEEQAAFDQRLQEVLPLEIEKRTTKVKKSSHDTC